MALLSNRRQFLATVGGVMELAALGIACPNRAAVLSLLGGKDAERLRFGALDPLVDLVQGTAPDELLAILVPKLRQGLELSDLVAATALANARALGGTNYDGYHALMALMPSYEMAGQMRGPLAALPVLKVVHRNARFIHAAGRAREDALAPLASARSAGVTSSNLAQQVRRGDVASAEAALAVQTGASLVDAYEQVQVLVRQDIDVHRVVLSWRAYDLLELAGAEHATTLLRQELRFCADAARSRADRGLGEPEVAALVPELVERHGLAGAERGARRADDAWIEQLASTCFESDRAASAEAVARALADGFDGADVSRALALTATWIVLHDRGRPSASEGKPAGSVHGANYGVHASDAANAWRHIAEIGSAQHAHATLIAAAYHTGGHRPDLAPESFDAETTPTTESDPARLLARIGGATRIRDSTSAGALARRYTTLGHAPEPLLAQLREVMVEQDGALHAEKYFRTVQEEHANARPAHRGSHLVALARVAASGYGFLAPGLEEARERLTA